MTEIPEETPQPIQSTEPTAESTQAITEAHNRITQIKEAAESVLAHLKRHLPEHHDDESDSAQP
jgi:hypothetical protein